MVIYPCTTPVPRVCTHFSFHRQENGNGITTDGELDPYTVLGRMAPIKAL